MLLLKLVIMFAYAAGKISPKRKETELWQHGVTFLSKRLCFKTSLKLEDTKFFYNVLYQYEKGGPGKPTGYSYNAVPSEIRKRVSFIHDTVKKKIDLEFPKSPNVLCFKGKGVCAPLLKHLRHCFAHACVEREGEYYVINSQMNPKCLICGKVKRRDLMNLVNAILDTKNKGV